MSESNTSVHSRQVAVRPLRTTGRVRLRFLTLTAIAAILCGSLTQAKQATDEVALSEFYHQLKSGNVAELVIDGDTVEGAFRTAVNLNGGSVVQFRTNLPQGTGGNWAFTQMVLDTSPGTRVEAPTANSVLSNFLLPLIPWLLILGFVWLFVVRPLRRKPRTPTPVVIVNPETV